MIGIRKRPTWESANKLSEAMEVLRTLPALAGGEEMCS
jgi:hypothetical protein